MCALKGTKMADEHKHGSMNIDAQQKTFDGFVAFTKWTVIIIFLVLIFLAIFAS